VSIHDVIDTVRLYSSFVGKYSYSDPSKKFHKFKPERFRKTFQVALLDFWNLLFGKEYE